MLVTGFPAGTFQTNCWLVATAPGSEALVVDPGQDALDGIDELCRRHRLKPVAALLTHGHLDHVWTVAPLAGAHGIPAFVHPADRHLLTDPLAGFGPESRAAFGGLTLQEPDDVRELADGQVVELAGVRLVVDHAPGHTQGHVTFRSADDGGQPGQLLAGDLVFAGSIGRTDLPAGRPPRCWPRWPPGSCPCRTRWWCCPATARPPPSAGSGPPTRSWPGSIRWEPGVSGRFEAPKGTFDQLPPASGSRAEVERIMLEQARLAGYQPIETPIFEDTAVFARGVGEATDVVQKEMYTFSDKGGRSLTLRPELTAGVVRALIEHGRLTTGLTKVVCSGPQFRYERPQAGRQRQFSQVDIEAMGSDAPAIDADVVLVGHEVFRRLQIPVTLLLTSLGDPVCRPAYREALLTFLHGLGDKLPAAARARAEQNPLRVLDMKDPLVEELTAEAPLMRDFLCGACKAHDEAVRELLAGVGVEWVEAPRLVRGLDYYVRTTFEWQAGSLDAAQNALGGGGRYDGLSEALGGPPAPGIGWALGLDRTVLALEQAGRLPADPWRLDALVLPLVPAAIVPAQGLVRDLRRAGLVADLPYADRTLNGHMKAAAKAGARTVVILGEQELAAGQAAVRDMTARDQRPVPLDQVVDQVRRVAGGGAP